MACYAGRHMSNAAPLKGRQKVLFSFDCPKVLPINFDLDLLPGLADQGISLYIIEPRYSFLGRICHVGMMKEGEPSLDGPKKFITATSVILINWLDLRGVDSEPFRTTYSESYCIPEANAQPKMTVHYQNEYVLDVEAIRNNIASLQELEPEDFLA